MLITFKRITMKNFMSVGNVPITIDLNRHNLTLISGKNGSAKSGITSDAIMFALYNKSYRGANKPQLINSINGKDCVVEIDFSVGNNDYRVIRGMKPAIFEIYECDMLLQQESANKDYQQILEQQILGMNAKTFKQISILSVSNYIPFMKLPALDRRQIIDELLDIQIFSKMFDLLKDKTKIIKSDLVKLDQVLYKINVNVESLKSTINKINCSDDNSVSLLQSNIEKNKKHIVDYNRKIHDNNERIDCTVDSQLSKLKSEYSEVSTQVNKVKQELKKINASISFYDSNSRCPQCNQDIDDKHKETSTFHLCLTRDVQSDSLLQLTNKLTDLSDKESNLLITVKNNESLRSEIYELTTKINSCKSIIENLSGQIEEIQNKKLDDIIPLQNKLSDLQKAKTKALDKKDKIELKSAAADVCADLLKDSGIKSQIIKKFVPAMNTIINQYLDLLEFSVSFTFDENFNEVIRSRYRDEFTYDSFSAGERSRIDLALLFMFRDISKLKNSVSTNILVIDEILESLDDSGVESAFRMFNDMDGVNIFVITHKTELQSRFRHRIELSKVDGFTIVE